MRRKNMAKKEVMAKNELKNKVGSHRILPFKLSEERKTQIKNEVNSWPEWKQDLAKRLYYIK